MCAYMQLLYELLYACSDARVRRQQSAAVGVSNTHNYVTQDNFIPSYSDLKRMETEKGKVGTI